MGRPTSWASRDDFTARGLCRALIPRPPVESRHLLLAQLRAQHGLVRALLAERGGSGRTGERRASSGLSEAPADRAQDQVAQLLDHLASCACELLRLAGRGEGTAPDPWTALEELLGELEEADLDRGPAAPLEPGVPAEGTTLRSLLAGHVGHLAWHLGQAARIRREAGLAPMPGWPQDSQRPLDG